MSQSLLAFQTFNLVAVPDLPNLNLWMGGEEHQEVQAARRHMERARRPAEYLLTFVGLPMEEAEWLAEYDLKNAQGFFGTRGG
jgi:hypothetical protein